VEKKRRNFDRIIDTINACREKKAKWTCVTGQVNGGKEGRGGVPLLIPMICKEGRGRWIVKCWWLGGKG